MRKRIVRIAAFMLAVVMVLTTSGLGVIAADLFEPSEQASDHAFDAAMVTAMAELCGSREAAEEVLESLYEKGFVDETGMPVESESFNVNGTVMTKEELRAEAETHVFDEQELVMIDGARITWSELKSLFAVMDMQDYIRSAEANGYHLTEKELASFAAALNEGRVKIITQDGKVYLSSGASTHPQGTNVAPEGVARIYLTEVDTDTYTVDFTNTSTDVLARYNLNSFTSMTYQLKPAHVYEEPATGKLYIDTKMTTPADVTEAARVTIQLTINALGGTGNFGGGAPVDGSDLTPLGGYCHILTSYRTTDFKGQLHDLRVQRHDCRRVLGGSVHRERQPDQARADLERRHDDCRPRHHHLQGR